MAWLMPAKVGGSSVHGGEHVGGNGDTNGGLRWPENGSPVGSSDRQRPKAGRWLRSVDHYKLKLTGWSAIAKGNSDWPEFGQKSGDRRRQ